LVKKGHDEAKHGFFTSLKCRECGRHYPKEAIHVCEFCFGPLEVDYDYELIKQHISREKIQERPTNMWRYRRTGFPSMASRPLASKSASRRW